jgi:hypothetical protein
MHLCLVRFATRSLGWKEGRLLLQQPGQKGKRFRVSKKGKRAASFSSNLVNVIQYHDP